MNLKRLEVFGFKSFADKLVIEFNNGITCIVGPNGCGKSNVADAIRWVLGEQSPRVLRGRNMQDIIFNGTANRKQLSYCEVSLVFDNEDKTYPIDYSEVIVTRKLFRSGESEYYINRNQCRLRDILDLFRDTGIGREGYSIIGQGRIAEILSVKADSRRAIFEEAAGISKYKVKKIETERNLVRTRDNLVRLNDIIAEIAQNLEPLEKEAGNAIKAKELKEKLKNLEVNTFIYQCENSKSERGKIEFRLNNVVNKIQQKEKDLNEIIRKFNVDMSDIQNTDIYTNTKREEYTKLLVDAEKEAGNSRVISTRLSNSQEDLKKLDASLVENNIKIGEKAKELAQKDNLSREKNDIFITKALKLRDLEKEYQNLNEYAANKEQELDKTNKLLMDSFGKLTEIKTNAVKLTAERDVAVDNLQKDNEILKEKKTLRDGLIKEMSALADSLSKLQDDKQSKLQEKEKAEINYKNAINDQKESLNKKQFLETRIAEINTKINMLESYKKNFEAYQGAARRLLLASENDPRIQKMMLGVVGEVITVPKDVQVAIEISLGGAIQNIITETEEDASFLIDYLKRSGGGRATFLPITSVRARPLESMYDSVLDENGVVGVASDLIRYDRKFNGILSNLLGRTIIVEDKENAIKLARKYRYTFRIVTLDGELFSQSGAITGGSVSSGESRHFARDAELEDLKKKLKSTANELNMIKFDLEDFRTDTEEIFKGVKILEAQIHRMDTDSSVLEQKISGYDSTLATTKDEIQKIEAEVDFLSLKISELNKLIKVANKEEGDTTAEKQDADEFINDTRRAFIEKKQERDQKQAETNKANIELSTLKNELASLDSDVIRLRAEIEMLNLSNLDLKAKRNTVAKDIESFEKELNMANYVQADKSKIEELQKTLREIEEHKKRIQENLARLDTERTQISKEITDLSGDKVREQGLIERLDTDLTSLAERVQEEYSLDYATAVVYKQEDFDYEKSNSACSKLKRQIENIGLINELAVDKFASESERYTDLKTQFDDLEKAEKDLLTIINDLTKEMKERFEENFNKINENFMVIFQELFNGGKGKLTLDSDSDDVLNAGIEIYAEPPGKKLSHISLLSGGEQALTAMAILFAIIKLKPMPFCVLDEIEAALDDANASLFAQYLRKFSKTTQFIVISHRKPTMELADILYGVTMQEKGVSKMVSVKLQEAIQAL